MSFQPASLTRSPPPTLRVSSALPAAVFSPSPLLSLSSSRPPVPSLLPLALLPFRVDRFSSCRVHVEVLKDVSFRIAPITPAEADRLVRSTRASALLDGHRGQPSADRAALSDAVARLSRLLSEMPEVLEAEANPFTVFGEGAGGVALDARVRVARGNGAPLPPC